MGPFLLPLLALFGCPDSGGRPRIDRDGDHWVQGYDCDDGDAEVHPWAPELCNDKDDDCDGEIDEEDAVDQPTWYADADGDGYGTETYAWAACTAPPGHIDNALDCDDLDAEVNPAADEACDEVDNDCDGEVDELGSLDPYTWYADADHDGYGDASDREYACEAPPSYVADSTDCDDTDHDINPGAAEVCDADDVDEDCDGLSDDGDPDAWGQSTFTADADGDTYGAKGGATVALCDQPAGYADDDDDCDDTDRTVNPSVREVCGDEVDNDCDGMVDAEDPDGEAVDWYADADADGYGDRDAWAGSTCEGPEGTVVGDLGFDCDDADDSVNPGAAEDWYDGVDSDCDGASDYDADGDGYESADWGGADCDDFDAARNPGETEVCGDGADNDCDGVADACSVDAVFVGERAGDEAGTSVAGLGDVDGDGFGDILIGGDHEDSGGAGAGAAWLVVGPVTGELDLKNAEAILIGEEIGDHAGISVAGPGDVDGDGVPDILVGAYDSDFTDASAGAAYLLDGDLDGEVDLSEATARLLGEAAGDLAGFAVAGAGDVDGDGLRDVLVGAYAEDGGGAGAGAAYLLHGPLTGNVYLWTADAKLVGESSGDQAGYALAGAGDVDADGYDDVVVGAPYEHAGGVYAGAAYLLLGAFRGTFDLSLADAKRTGETSGDLAGYAVGGGGDVDGDGYDDVIVGVPEDDEGGSGSGAAWVLHGPFDGDASLVSGDLKLVGEDNDDQAGCAVAVAGDVDGDGAADLVVGARLDDTEESDAGAAYIAVGPTTGTLDLGLAGGKAIGEAAGDWAGAAVSGAGDVDGDGTDDVLVGVPYEDGGGEDAGAAWLILGGRWP